VKSGLVLRQAFNLSGKSIVFVPGSNGTIQMIAGTHSGGAVTACDSAWGELPAEAGTGVTAFN